MITLDSIKIKIPMGDMRMIWGQYKQNDPYKLRILPNHEDGIWLIEFSSKILRDDYPLLISRETIEQAFYHINEIDGIELNVEAARRNAEVLKCDITKDIRLSDMVGIDNWRDLKTIINCSRTSMSQWSVKNYRGVGNGIVIENATSSPRYHRRVVFYDKEHELQLSKNRTFLNTLEDRGRVLSHFEGKVRIEANLYCQEQIRKYFNIQSTNLMDVLTSNANPLQTIITEMFEPIYATSEQLTMLSVEKMALLKQCDFDLDRVEAIIRANSTNVRRAMRPYKVAALQHLIGVHREAISVNLSDYV